MILTAFYHVKNYKGQKLERLSVDVPDAGQVDEVLDEVGIQNETIYTRSYGQNSPALDTSELPHFMSHTGRQGIPIMC